jgi:hypothetical protein
VKPSNVLVQGGQRVVLIDISFGELRPSWWRQAVDLADMLLILGLLAGPERALARARLMFSDDELSEALAVAGPVTVPRQLRTCVEATGRDLIGEFRALLPPRRPVRIQRWSARRVGLALATVAGAGLAVVLLWANLRAGGML